MSSWTIQFSRSAEKELEKLPKRIVERIRDAIAKLSEDPVPKNCKKLKGENHTYRLRVGDYRVIYELLKEEIVILIIRVRHRKDAYK